MPLRSARRSRKRWKDWQGDSFQRKTTGDETFRSRAPEKIIRGLEATLAAAACRNAQAAQSDSPTKAEVRSRLRRRLRTLSHVLSKSGQRKWRSAKNHSQNGRNDGAPGGRTADVASGERDDCHQRGQDCARNRRVALDGVSLGDAPARVGRKSKGRAATGYFLEKVPDILTADMLRQRLRGTYSGSGFIIFLKRTPRIEWRWNLDMPANRKAR